MAGKEKQLNTIKYFFLSMGVVRKPQADPAVGPHN